LGTEISILASKMFEIGIERKSQNPIAIFMGQKQHGEEVVLKVQGLIETRLAKTMQATATRPHNSAFEFHLIIMLN
jgi:hypothetical protein